METPPQPSEEETSPRDLRRLARAALGASAVFAAVTASAVPEVINHSQNLGSDNMNVLMAGPPLVAGGIISSMLLRRLAHIREERALMELDPAQ